MVCYFTMENSQVKLLKTVTNESILSCYIISISYKISGFLQRKKVKVYKRKMVTRKMGFRLFKVKDRDVEL